MNTNDNISEELDDEFEDEISFSEQLYTAISPKIKQFLVEYYGDNFHNLKSETYLEIETLIEDDILLFASEIPDILYRNRTITDEDKFDEALDNFVPDNIPINWPVIENWFDRDFKEEEEEDTFLEDSNPIDLTEDQKKAKEIVELANEMTENTQSFAHFMKSGYEIVIKEVQLFLKNNASFDLSILSPDGFIALQTHLDLLVSTLLEDLNTLLYEE
ncbi:MAG: hypothetical protein A2275_04955 [Bacteroidetes bacterium RIFOXYA12_FULL_35_11]|nr:MAG: hypothetical protein A2X01_14725 [Bacteroidetes bacterium GWF2_35_48]OFY75934.1 MAG: hypothetical protein A2275_04955 [Bacteroidetes bacterium RIFOXYA12_FULL_35_11]OFY92472.1 MAG: hypothetical protein A2491_10685 [Bacteroidetes bacterium RIFOXYC12_FULL_35_7]OFY95999.1 MAG: hypothetical protein A2309_02495 [Bacteroidetes bacterium RIFOXYB2_FULL_35_7]HBX51553.1 hypothetical protein [Bacteroidales bacterium]